MARGTGRTGALGMAPRSGDLVRPLLVLEARETRAWCAARGLDPVVATRPTTTRATPASRVRHGLLPALAAVHPGRGPPRRRVRRRPPRRGGAHRPAGRRGVGARRARRRPRPARRCAPSRAPMRRLLVRRLVADAGLPAATPWAPSRSRGCWRCWTAAGPPRCRATGAPRWCAGCCGSTPRRPARPGAAPLGVPGRVALRRRRGARARGRGRRARAPTGSRCRDAGPLHVRPPRDGDRLAIRGGGRRGGRAAARRRAACRRALRPLVPVVATRDRVVWVAGHRAAADLVTAGPGPGIVLELERA